MRHRSGLKKLGVKSAHRKMLLRNLATALLKEECIRTTLPKAKALRSYIEPLITLAKESTLHHQRQAFDTLRDRDVISKLFGDIGKHYSSRPGGYTRIIKCGFRPGDNAPMAFIQLVARD
ncbi:MAG: 50S ribosomal protein L17 [Pseudomonadota bacterium]